MARPLMLKEFWEGGEEVMGKESERAKELGRGER
jgi:hypothetical protein